MTFASCYKLCGLSPLTPLTSPLTRHELWTLSPLTTIYPINILLVLQTLVETMLLCYRQTHLPHKAAKRKVRTYVCDGYSNHKI